MPASLLAQSSADIELAKQIARQQGYTDDQINAMIAKKLGTTDQGKSADGAKRINRNEIKVSSNQNGIEQMYGISGQTMQGQQGLYGNRNQLENMAQGAAAFSQQGESGLQYGYPDFDNLQLVFGRDIFKNENLNFVPSYNIPTPENYKLSAGDEVVIDVWGAVVTNIVAEVTPDGSIYIPDLGPVYIYGESIKEAEKSIKQYLSKIYSGIGGENPDTFVKLSLGKIKSVTVNVIGDVVKPGSYTLPSLSSIASALYLAEGPNDIGTVRNVRLLRGNREVARFDLYDYMLSGKTDLNVRLEDNDVITVSPYTGLVYLLGGVKRPMKYEIKEKETVADLLGYGGGFSDNAYTGSLLVERKKASESGEGAVFKSFIVDADEFGTFELQDGDVVTVTQNDERFVNRVKIAGAVWRPGVYSISDKMPDVKSLIVEAGGLKENAYLDKGFIVRMGKERGKEQVSFNLKNVILGVDKYELMPDDSVQIFYIDSLVPKQDIVVEGEVNSPGKFEYRKGMTLGDAILMSGGLNEAASLERIEVARRIFKRFESEENLKPSDTISIVLSYNLLKNPQDSDALLEPFDIVIIRQLASYKHQQRISVEGEVNYPGAYVMEKNTVRLSDVIRKAGGVGNDAYVKGAKLTRVLTDDEFDRLKTAMIIAKKQAADTTAIDSLEIGDRFSIAIDLEKAIKNPGTYADVVLRDNDIITVPKLNNTVKISGGVLYPNTISYNPDMRYKEYISNAGGFVKGSIPSRVYMVHMNGSVAKKGSKEFKVQPGTEIVVPLKDKTDRTQSTAAIMSLATSSASLAAMIVTIINAL